jgi:predicted RNA-binding protein Jag
LEEWKEESYPQIKEDEKSQSTVSSCWTRRNVSEMFKEAAESSESDLSKSFRMIENLHKQKSQFEGMEQEWKTKLHMLEEKKHTLLNELDKVNTEIETIQNHLHDSNQKNTELEQIDTKLKAYLQELTSMLNL